jgi:hypothetical protein
MGARARVLLLYRDCMLKAGGIRGWWWRTRTDDPSSLDQEFATAGMRDGLLLFRPNTVIPSFDLDPVQAPA